MNLSSHRRLGAAPGLMMLCLVVVVLASSCGDSPGDSVPDVPPPTSAMVITQCEEAPVIPSFTITGAEVPDSGELIIEGQINGLSIAAGVVDISISDGAEVVELTIENSGVDEIDLASGSSVVVEYWYRQGFEGVAQGLRVSDSAGVVLVVEDGDYGNALGPAELEPFTVAQSDIGCRNRANDPGSLNNFALTIEDAGASAELMPGARSIITVDGNDFAVRNLRSTSRHSDVEWTDAPYTYTSFSIARLADGSSIGE